MTVPRYMRTGLPSWAWGLLILCAIVVALVVAGRATVSAIREDERSKVLAEGERVASWASSAERQHWKRLVDSLHREAGKIDTVLDTVLVRAQGESRKPIPPATDTAALVTAVRSCRATLDTLAATCARFRETATKALAAADTQHARDTAAIGGLAVRVAALQRTTTEQTMKLAQMPTWGTVTKVCTTTGVISGVLGFVAGVAR